MNALPDIKSARAVSLARTILHPTNFAPGDASALAHATALAQAIHARLSLLHIRAEDETIRDGLNPLRDLLQRWGHLSAADRFADLKAKLGFSAASFAVPARSVAQGVLEHFANHPVELAVLSTYAHSGLAYWFAGSTSRRVLRQADTMILFLREGGGGFVDTKTGAITLRRVLIPVDGRIPSAAPIARARELIDHLGVKVEKRLLHIGTSPPADIPKDIPLKLAQGPVAETILEAAREFHADLIIMPTAGKRGLLGAFRNSVSAAILDDARYPVLSVPARDEIYTHS